LQFENFPRYREDDVANELQSLSLEANKGRKEENSVEEERAPVKKKEKVAENSINSMRLS
jgi:hypothetical protein